MRGYSALGVEGVSKIRNAGAVIRTAHAFHASFAFMVGGEFSQREIIQSDTSKALEQLPFHMFDSVADFRLPQGCQLVGIELTEDAHLLPSFRHPRMAAYVLGSERMGLSDDMLGLCDHVIQIPTRFSLNLAVAGALVLYDRMQSMERFAPRPLMPGGGTETPKIPAFGDPLWVRKHNRSK
jgi:tRNA G18 (ribose-2'-O)-methylase SpoU